MIRNFVAALLLTIATAFGQDGSGISAPSTRPLTRELLKLSTAAEIRSLIQAPAFTDTIATLVALTGAAKTNIVKVHGYFLANDGGGGDFLWVPASTASTNYGSVFVPLGQSTATAGRWERIIEGSSIDCRMWGVMGYGISDESGRFQDLVNYVMPNTTRQRNITIPGNASILLASPIIIGTTNNSTAVGWDFTHQLSIEGDNRALSGTTAAPKFVLTGTNQLGFAAQFLRGVTFRNFSIEGRNAYQAQVPSYNYYHDANNYVLAGSDVRTNRYSPHAGIVIDPFTNTLNATNQYPGLSHFYAAGTANGGSSRVKFEGVSFYQFVAGAVISAGGTVFNAEEIDFVSCTFANNMNSIGYGQAQTKANSVRDCRFIGAHVAITCTGYGNGAGFMPNVYGGEFLQVAQMIRPFVSFGGFLMEGVFAEEVLAIGAGVSGSRPLQATFVGCDFHFTGGTLAPEYIWYSTGSTTFKGCNFLQSGIAPFTFYGPDQNLAYAPIVFDDCNFIQQTEVDTQVHKEFIVTNGETKNGNTTFRPLLFRNSRVRKGNNSTSVQLDSAHIVTSSLANLNGKMVLPGATIIANGIAYQVSDIPPTSANHTISGISYVSGSGTGTFVVNSPNHYKVGDAVKSSGQATWATGLLVNAINMYVGYISAVSGTTNTISGVPYAIADNFGGGASSFTLTWIPRFHEPTVGTITSGSSTISDVSPNPTTVWFVGDRISGTGIPPGSHVTAVTSTNLTITGTATATGTAVALYDAIYSKVLDTGILSGLGNGYLRSATTNGVVTFGGSGEFSTTYRIFTPADNLTTTNIDWSLGNKFFATLSTNTTFTFSNPTDAQEIELRVQSEGTNTITWPPNVNFPYGGTAPALTPNGVDVYSLTYNQGYITATAFTNYAKFITPTNVSGLQLWLDGSDASTLYQDAALTTPAVLEGAAIGGIRDKSGNTNTIVQASTNKKSTVRLGVKNNRSVIRLDGVNDDFTFPAITLADHTIFVVATSSDTTSRLQPVLNHPSSGGIRMQTGATSYQWSTHVGGADHFSSAIDNNTFSLYDHVNVAGVSINSRLNGASLYSAASSYASANWNQIGIWSALSPFKGDIAEILIYNRALTETERQQVELYLQSKWGTSPDAALPALVANPQTDIYLKPADIDTSTELADILSDEVGTGVFVRHVDSPLTTPIITGAINFPDNTRQTFNPGADAAGLNVGSHAGDPGTPSNGDLWYDSAANELTARINGANVALGAGGGGGLASTDIDTSAELFGIVGDESGSGVLVGSISPTITTPIFSGLTYFGGTSSSFPAIKRSSATLQFRLADDSDYANVNGGTYTVGSTSLSDNTLNFNGDTILNRDAANTFALRNATSAQVFRIYNTYTDSSNYQRLGFAFNAGVAEISAENAGTGAAMPLLLNGGGNGVYLSTSGTSRWRIPSTGHFQALADNTYDIGASAATRPRTGYFGTSLRAPKHEISATVFWTSGSGTPEGSVTADIGSLYSNTSGGANTTLYRKESGTGNTGWVAVAAGSGLASTDIDTSAEVATIVGDETGSGALVFGTSPTVSGATLSGSITVSGSASVTGRIVHPPVSIATDIDWSLGNNFIKTLSGNTTFTFSNPVSGQEIKVRVLGAGHTLTWPAVSWAGGATPTQSANLDFYTIYYDGSSYWGSAVQNH